MIRSTLSNEKGILTLDFVFASMLIFGLSTVIFSFGMALSTVEVVQYISYATARNYALAHENEAKQEERGEAKFNELINQPAFAAMLAGGWYKVDPVELGDFNSDFSPNADLDSDLFWGAIIPFNAPILFKRIPLVGNTGDNPDAFRANIQSFLGREPTFQECQEFMSQRGRALLNVRGGSYGVFQDNQVAILMDNGC